MNLLVTGASGFIGSGILQRAPREWALAATYFSHPPDASRARLYKLDLRDERAIDRIVDDAAPQAILHAAAVMQGNDLTAVNVEGARRVARAASRVHARMVHLSTDVVFDGEHPPYSEQAAPSPITPYGRSKADAELAVRADCPSALIIRTSLVYRFDPPDPRTRQTLAGEMPFLFTDEFRCPIQVNDLADAILELVQSDEQGILHVAGPQSLSRYEFGLRLAFACGMPPRFAPARSGSSGSPRPRDCSLDIGRALTLLRVPLRSVDEVLQHPAPTD